ncbi:LacI family DNA-binding transcriptional regulator [Martelella sp. HB161492]|uniref:LacI family DNA-binding transcriptional regulator n=1 Tax=Martelella sp. HB161492 TaxID=2720726 RepID=UPI0015929DA5|nr:LacI family DNA-binding transcriptional regulator [Martelella sp. HB161492]
MAKTISEIAEDTGYSRTTITMVLSGRATEYRISERAQNIINAYVAEHGYTINQTARNLKTKRSHTVGFIAPDIANAFFARIMAHLEAHCRAEGLVLITTSSLEDPEVEARALNSLLARGVDGLVMAPCAPRQPEQNRKRGKNTPLVLIDRAYPDDHVPVISSNHEASARRITREIIDSGARQIAFLCGHPENPSIQDRVIGFYGAGGEAGLGRDHLRVLTARDDSVSAGRQMMKTLFGDAAEPPSAILCSSLLVLEGALQFFKSEHGGIPAELIIGTFDYDGLLDFIPNTVLVVKQDEEALAEAAFQVLLKQINGRKDPETARSILETSLVRLG